MAITAQQIHDKAREITAPGQFFEIEEREIGGQRLRVFKHASATLIDVLQASRAHGDQDFLVYEGSRLTFTQFFAEADALAAALARDHGISRGDRVAIAMRNCPEWSVAFTAASLIGAIVVPINSWGKTEELRYAVSDSRAKCLVCDEARYRLAAGANEELGIDVLVAGMPEGWEGSARVARFEQAIARGRGAAYALAAPSPEDPCVILYTSGSTGFPKGVLHRHVAVTQSLMNMFFLGFLMMQLEGQREFRGGATRETPILTVPLFHCTGLLSGLLLPLQTAQKVVMMYKWDSRKALALIQEEKVTQLTSVPAILMDLLAHPDFERYDTSSLFRVSAAGAATPAGLPELMAQKLGSPSRSAGYGMTETMAVTSTMSGAIYDLSPNSAGIVSPIVDIRFAAADDSVMASGEQGEIQLRSVVCTPGYWEKPEANAKLFTADGWMHTGDVGLIDAEGFLHITGRIKELVIRGGENIYPGEIENVAYRHADVQEAVVFGVDDARMGEELAMVCHPRHGATLDAVALREHLVAQLAAYKVPKYIAISSEPLPRNASEKLHKLNVKAAYLAGKYAVS